MENKLVDSQTVIYASKEREGPIAQWLELNRPFITDVSKTECLDDWPAINNPDRALERKYIEDFFAEAKREGRYIETEHNEAIQQRALELNQKYNIKPGDDVIAATAEINEYLLVTADNKRNFAPRLEKLNQQGDGHFKVNAYNYNNRNQTFQQWLQA